MRIIGLLSASIGGGILVGYYLETSNPWLTTGLVFTITGIMFGLVAGAKK